MSGTTPCYQCAERRPGCHGRDASGCWRCEKYGAYKERREAELAAVSARLAAIGDVKVTKDVIARRARHAANRG